MSQVVECAFMNVASFLMSDWLHLSLWNFYIQFQCLELNRNYVITQNALLIREVRLT